MYKRQGFFWQGSHFRLILRLLGLPFALQADLLLQVGRPFVLQVGSCFRIVFPSLFTYLLAVSTKVQRFLRILAKSRNGTEGTEILGSPVPVTGTPKVALFLPDQRGQTLADTTTKGGLRGCLGWIR